MRTLPPEVTLVILGSNNIFKLSIVVAGTMNKEIMVRRWCTIFAGTINKEIMVRRWCTILAY